MAKKGISKWDIILPLASLTDSLLVISDEAQDIWLSGEWESFVRSLQIMTKEEGLQFLLYNDAQLEFWEQICEARRRKVPGRFVVLKYRQKGFSTEVQSIMFSDCVLRPNRYSYTASFEYESAEYLMGMSHIFWDHLRADIKARRRLKAQAKLRLKFSAPHNSRITAATANRRFLASSQTIHNFHASELAKWPDPPAKDALQSVLNCVPNSWDTLVVIESTAYGVNLFKDYWDEANAQGTEGWNHYEPVFVSWRDRPDCFIQVTEDIRFTEAELTFQKEEGISDEQLAWFHMQRVTRCHNDMDEAHQEYPLRPMYAFKFSGGQWFDNDGLEWMKNRLMDPIARGELVWDHAKYPVVLWRDVHEGLIEIYERPVTGRHYVIAADIAEGVGGRGDFTSFAVYLIPIGDEPIRQVCHGSSNKLNAADAGEILFMLGIYYNKAFVCPEVNNQGILTCNVLEEGKRSPQMRGGYPFLYYRLVYDEKNERETAKVGWHTKDHSTKDLMLGDVKDVVRNNGLIIRSKAAFLELEGFSYDTTKRKWVGMYKNPTTKTRHDDEVMQTAIAIQAINKRRSTGAADYTRGEE